MTIERVALKVGLQIVYDNGFKREQGFVSSWNDQTVFCRFWNKDMSGLRTTSISEGCRYADIKAVDYTSQKSIDKMVNLLRSKPDHFGWFEQEESLR